MKPQAPRIPDVGDVYWVNPNPAAGRELKNRHRFIAITPRQINALGVTMMVAVVSGGQGARIEGLTVPIQGYDTAGVAVCTQVRSFDLRAVERDAQYIEKLDGILMGEIIRKVVSIIDPAPE